MNIDEQLSPDSVYYQRFGAFTVMESPFGGSEPAHVSYQLTFTETSNPTNWNNTDLSLSLGEVVLFHYSLWPYIGVGGFSLVEGRTYCCSQDLYNQGKCFSLNSLIINAPLDQDDLYYLNLNFTDYQNLQKSATIELYTDLVHTGIWYLFIADCDQRHGVPLSISGYIEWKNPYGYLPGQVLGELPLYWLVSIIYIILGAMWGLSAWKYRHDMVPLQHAIGIVIFVSVIECLTWAGYYSTSNQNGLNATVTNVFSALFSSFKLTMVRTLMLVVAIGYSITRSTIERGYKIGIAVLSIIYFIIECVNLFLAVAEASGKTVDSSLEMCFLVLLVIANAVVFGWIGYEIYSTAKKIKQQKAEKLMMYKRLSLLLAACLAFSVFIVIAKLIIEATNSTDTHFRSEWLWQGCWELIYVTCLIFVAWEWRPNDKNRRFAYVDITEPEEEHKDDKEGVGLDEDDESAEGINPSKSSSSKSSSGSSDSSSSSSFKGPKDNKQERKEDKEDKNKTIDILEKLNASVDDDSSSSSSDD